MPYNKDAAKSTAVRDMEDFDTYDGLFKNYKSFHRLFGDQDRDARSSHSATMSYTSLEAVYNFLQKVIMFLRSSAAQDTIKNVVSVLDDLQRVNSTVMEAQLMSHDAGVTAIELYTHLHMLQRRTDLESPAVNSPQRDKVMSVGGNDLFGPNAHKVQEWKKDTEEEKVKLISKVFDERGRMTSPQRRSQLLLLSVLLAL